MPEIAEVSRVCHYLRKHLANRKIASVLAQEDPIIYLTSKTSLTAAKLQSSLKGKTVVDAKQQGKYFWLELDSPPHLLCHFGMTGWVKFSNDDAAYYKPQKERIKEEKEAKAKAEKEEEEDDDDADADSPADWPPRFWKFVLQMEGDPKVEAAFVDGRRLGRVRLIDVAANDMRNTTPLKENGPDPVQDKDVLTVEWLGEKLRSKKVPIKALLLDQAVISGVGNWVADETLYQAKIHPEQYSNSFSDTQVKQLHDSLMDVCTIACDVLADSSRFPEHWLMRHRWNKGKKDENVLPNGEKIIHLKVGGRTSAIVPSVQKKTGAVSADVDGKPKRGGKGKAAKEEAEDDEDANEIGSENERPKKSTTPKRKAKVEVKSEEDESEVSSKRRSARGKGGKKVKEDEKSAAGSTSKRRKR